MVAEDSATVHTSDPSINYLRGRFPEKLISKLGDWPWPPRSPDLAILRIFSLGPFETSHPDETIELTTKDNRRASGCHCDCM